MKIDDVPQEKNKTLNGVRKAVYAVDAEGNYTTVASDGWHAEEIVTTQAVEEFERLSHLAYIESKKGLASPLAFHMYQNRMDISLLSQTTGFFQWTIKRDFRIAVFNKMSEKRLQAYADVMGIEVEDLLSVR